MSRNDEPMVLVTWCDLFGDEQARCRRSNLSRLLRRLWRQTQADEITATCKAWPSPRVYVRYRGRFVSQTKLRWWGAVPSTFAVQRY